MTAAKMKEQQTWTQVTPGWRKYDAELVQWGAPVSGRMMELAGIGIGQRVLDIACGTGEPAIPAAQRVGPKGSVVGVDFVEEMLVLARQKAAKAGLKNIEFKRQDGEELDAPELSFDVVTMRFGLMFMPDPVACLKRAHRSLKPRGRIALATWAQPDKNPWVTTAMGVLRRHIDVPAPPPGATGLFAMADPERVRSTMAAALFKDIRLEEVATRRDFGDGRAYFNFTFELAGPLANLLGKLPVDERTRVADEVAAEAEKLRRDGRLEIGGVSWVASAVK